MKFRYLESQEYPLWDEFVDSSPQGSIYAKSFYLDALGASFKIAVVEEGSTLLGGIILAKNELGLSTNPLFVKYLGILYHSSLNKDARRQSTRYKIDRIIISNISKYGVWSYTFHPNYTNWLSFYWTGYHQTTRYTYQIRFVQSADFRKLYREKVSHPLRQAEKNRLVVDDVSTDEFIKVNTKTYQGKHARPPYSSARLKTFLISSEKAGYLYKKGVRGGDGNIHSVAAIVYDKKSANLILQGNDPQLSNQGGGTLLLDHLIEFASLNSSIFDFEGSMIERIELFYRGFGGDIVPYFKICKANLPTFLYEAGIKTYKRLFYR